MLFFFAWERAPVIFNPAVHARMDLDIFALTMVHEEGHYARAHLTVHPQATLPLSPWGILSVQLPSGETLCLFQGARSHAPKTIDGNLIEIELVACPPNADTQLHALLDAHKQSTDLATIL